MSESISSAGGLGICPSCGEPCEGGYCQNCADLGPMMTAPLIVDGSRIASPDTASLALRCQRAEADLVATREERHTLALEVNDLVKSLAAARAECKDARREAEWQRDTVHRDFCVRNGYDPESTSKMLLLWEREPAEGASEGRYTTPAETGRCFDAHGVERPPNPATETTWVSAEPPPSVDAPHVADQTPPEFVAMAAREEFDALRDLMLALAGSWLAGTKRGEGWQVENDIRDLAEKVRGK